MSVISQEQHGQAQEMTVLSPGHDRDPVGSAKRIVLTLTDEERGSNGDIMAFLAHGSFAAEIRTSGDASSPADFIVVGKSDDLRGGHADVSVTDRSGKVVMSITRAKRHTMLMLGNENATVKFASGDAGSYSGMGRSLTLGGTEYAFNVTNKCAQCCYICGAFMCFIPTLGLGTCYMMSQMTKAKSTADFKENDRTIGDFDLWFYAQPFEPEEGGGCCGKPKQFDTLLSVDVSDPSQWTVDRKWAMLAMVVATAMDSQLDPPCDNNGGGGGG